MALSMFDSIDVAGQLADRVPKLGGHIATLDLQPDLGICIAKTGGHDLTSTLGHAGDDLLDLRQHREPL
jgi:hypothetical protein